MTQNRSCNFLFIYLLLLFLTSLMGLHIKQLKYRIPWNIRFVDHTGCNAMNM